MPKIEQQIERWLKQQERIAAQALRAVAPEFAATAQAGGAYQDDTGANRAATASYAVGLGIDDSRTAERAAREADRLNEGHAFLTTAPGPQGGVGIIVTTTATDYAIFLERDAAGAHAYLGDALRSEAPAAQQQIAQEIARRNGGR